MISKEVFVTRIKQMPDTIRSKTKEASYTDFKLNRNMLHFTRVNTGEVWDLDIDELYDIYCNNDFINTSVIKSINGGRVNSPSVAILMAIGCLDDSGNRL